MFRARSFYPGFLAALFLVLLRVAIGWHFLYEGVWKFNTRYEAGGKPFSAEPYLRYSTGPLGPYFRGMLPDVNSLAKLDPPRLKAEWKDTTDRLVAHYGFDADQQAKAKEELGRSEAWVDAWFRDPLTAETRKKYVHDLGAVQKVESDWHALQNRREWAVTARKGLDKDRRDLIKDIDARAGALREALGKLATKEQAASAGPYVEPTTKLDLINGATTLGLITMGVCLMLGLLTRISALAGVVFLAQIYLCMPPWPGYPSNPSGNEHVMIVNAVLIELFALSSLVFLPTGQWVGLDALLFGWYRRRRERAAEDRARRARERERDRGRASSY